MNNKHLKFEKRWEAKHPIYRLEANVRAYVEHPEVPGCECNHMITSINNAVCAIYYEKRELGKAVEMGERVIASRRDIRDFIKKAKFAKDGLFRISKEIYGRNLSSATNEELKNLYKDYFNSFINLLSFYNLSRPDYLIKIDKKIKKEIALKEPDLRKRDELFVKITRPLSNNVLTEHEIAQLKSALYTLNKKGGLKKRLPDLIKDYSWISTQENNPPFDIEYYTRQAEEFMGLGKKELRDRIRNLENRPALGLSDKKDIIRNYKFSKSFLELAESVAGLGELRLNIRFWWTESSYRSSNLFEELNKRIGLENKKFLNWYYSEYLLEKEVYDSLDGKIKISEKEIEERIKKSLLLMIDKKVFFFLGREAAEKESKYIFKEDYSRIKMLKGQTANGGFVRGRVWVISPETLNQVEKANKMKKDQILVAAMTRPQFIEGINKAKAIITDEGGIICHAAIISRELNRPCVVGTRIASKVLKDGDLVEVDAYKGTVKILKKHEQNK